MLDASLPFFIPWIHATGDWFWEPQGHCHLQMLKPLCKMALYLHILLYALNYL
jgi:hypothetical protein